MTKPVMVVSGINLIDGGAYSVFTDCLYDLIQNGYSKKYSIIALVGNRNLFLRFENEIQLIEFPKSKKSWFSRLYYEYIYFDKFSKKHHVDTWLSLHDMTPNVHVRKQYLYCHNPSPFNKMSVKNAKFGIKYYLFSKLYKYLYKVNIHNNDAIIVQQDWMRQKFIEMFHLENKVIVAKPAIPSNIHITNVVSKEPIFVFPSFPRYFKNFETVCAAAQKLSKSNRFKLYITLDGTENRYARELVDKYSNCDNIIFCGLLARQELYKLYGKSSALIFLSRLETWGMPITEYQLTGKQMIVSDLPYAHETVGNYEYVQFADVDSAEKVAQCMELVINSPNKKHIAYQAAIKDPFASNWNDLFKMIL